MPGMAVGMAAANLPWLCPRTDNLIALADKPETLPQRAKLDPALALLLLRLAPSLSFPQNWTVAELASPRLPAWVLAYLQRPACGVLPWSSHAWQRLWQWACQAARQAAAAARQSRRVSPSQAYFAALLAPLGWYAVAAIDPLALGDVLHDPQAQHAPRTRQQATWGLDHAAIARRLALRWNLPPWLSEIVGKLHLPSSLASQFAENGEVPPLVPLVQWAWREVERADPAAAALGLTPETDTEVLTVTSSSADGPPFAPKALAEGAPRLSDPDDGKSSQSENPACLTAGSTADDPYQVPLLLPLLRQALGHRQQQGATVIARFENEVDQLHAALERAGRQAASQLQQAKLAALAEFAAGAAHEINNPLAIITAQVQNLLRKETDTQRREAFQVILKQSQRIADLLKDVMTFARPPRPQRSPVPLTELLLALRRELHEVLQTSQVRLEIQADDPALWLNIDIKQVLQGLGAVLRNAVEAAAAGGWVRLRVEATPAWLHILVEDSGPGLSPAAAEHAFDPFYSGREAGRGRGLGLPLAWRLLQQNEGNLRYEPLPETPGRFRISLPRCVDPPALLRQSA
ncbi:HDOD domain-containing protein [thermophilic bacterium 2918]|uniref:histidine kinase n=2 Tax=Thermogemmata fonticola TaxID=2755323 RepID=A0A7V9AA77_9BACT|nr:HDOD domain-containing protein [Thermogemmata fonticola]